MSTTNDSTTPAVSTQDEITIAAAVAALTDGRILLVQADRLAGQRSPKRNALPAVNVMVWRVVGDAYAVDGLRMADRDIYATPEEAVRAVRRLLSWDRLDALRSALVNVYGAPERAGLMVVEDARIRREGARLNGFVK